GFAVKRVLPESLQRHPRPVFVHLVPSDVFEMQPTLPPRGFQLQTFSRKNRSGPDADVGGTRHSARWTPGRVSLTLLPELSKTSELLREKGRRIACFSHPGARGPRAAWRSGGAVGVEGGERRGMEEAAIPGPVHPFCSTADAQD